MNDATNAPVLLVRVECLCGAIAAFPEGGCFPLCGFCGRRMVLPQAVEPRRERGMAYVAILTSEQEAVRQTRHAPHQRQRVYSDDDLRAGLEARGWPTEDQSPNWPQRPRRDADDGSTYGVPPWEDSGVSV